MIKKIKHIFYLLIVLLILAVISIPLIITIGNDGFARGIAKEVKQVSLPSETEIISTKSIADKIVGNGNGMQYLGVVLIKSNTSLHDLEEYYIDYDILVYSVDGTKIDKTDREKTAVKASVEWMPIDKTVVEKIAFKELENLTDFSNYYVLYKWGRRENPDFWDFDLRGH